MGYFGIFPEENTSGVDRQGNKIPPGTMHMAVRELYARLKHKGTRGDVALGHCMRKLLHQAFGVWASNTPFDEELARARHMPSSDSPCETEMQPKPETAAGHKRDMLPERKVVTAASSSVKRPTGPVNQTRNTPDNRVGSIDYAYLRQQITMEQVLSHLGYLDRLQGAGAERRGPCPLHQPTHARSQSFTVNMSKQVFRCCHPECGAQGNALDLWAAAHRLPLYEAGLDLAKTFHLETARNREEAARNVARAQTYQRGG